MILRLMSRSWPSNIRQNELGNLIFFEGAAIYPKSISGRILFVFWWLFTIIMVATYTANLAAYLTVTLTRKPVNSLEELAQSTAVTPLIQSGTNLHTLFEVYSRIIRKVYKFNRPIVIIIKDYKLVLKLSYLTVFPNISALLFSKLTMEPSTKQSGTKWKA